MKVLLSAVSCNPEWGSETHFGWTAMRALAKRHDLWVITHGHHRTQLEAARDRKEIPENVTLIYHGDFSDWHSNPMIARLQSWMDFRKWMSTLLPLARRLHAEIGFDIAHHVTVSTWRVASPLWKLGVPFVWGPLGGAETFPMRLYPILSWKSRAYELFRSASNAVSAASPTVRRCACRASHIFASNRESETLLTRLRGTSEGVSVLSAAFFGGSETGRFGNWAEKQCDGPLKIFAGGTVEGRKGLAIALRSLAIARDRGVDFTFTVGGHGPEIGHLRELAASLGIADRVEIGRGFRGDEYVKHLQRSHIYLLPSLRDSAGITLLEAMLAGCVPVVAACGGPGEIVSEECGIAVKPAPVGAMVEKIARILCDLDGTRKKIRHLGWAARDRIRECYSEENYLRQVDAVYQQVVGSKSRPSVFPR